ncbi:MAG: capsular biosynthesis protein [Bacteroidaceae bacterium]|nr:capsular biosynthesis protein [Bacteroidaceae bacterium]
MWFWNKKHTIAASGILQGAADHHSHILPGVDDGVETMEESLHILGTYEELGIKELWLTPHIMEDIPNTPEKLKARFVQLQATYNGNITLHLAAEYMIDNHLRKLLPNHSPSYVRGASNTVAEGDRTIIPLETNNSPSLPRGTTRGSVVCDDGYFSTQKECPIGATKGEGVETNSLLPIGNSGKHILVETSYFNPPMRFKETLRQIKSLGYYPLLAHPERYMYMDNDEYRRLREEGVKFQLNLASLAGGYGKAVKKKALWLLENGFYSVAGSDLQCEDAIEYITSCKLDEKSLMNVAQLLKNRI